MRLFSCCSRRGRYEDVAGAGRSAYAAQSSRTWQLVMFSMFGGLIQATSFGVSFAMYALHNNHPEKINYHHLGNIFAVVGGIATLVKLPLDAFNFYFTIFFNWMTPGVSTCRPGKSGKFGRIPAFLWNLCKIILGLSVVTTVPSMGAAYSVYHFVRAASLSEGSTTSSLPALGLGMGVALSLNLLILPLIQLVALCVNFPCSGSSCGVDLEKQSYTCSSPEACAPMRSLQSRHNDLPCCQYTY